MDSAVSLCDPSTDIPVERWAFYADVINLFNGRNITQIDSLLAVDPTADRPRIREVAQDRGIPFFQSLGFRFWF